MTPARKVPKRPQGARVRCGVTPSRWPTLQAGVCGCFPSVESRPLARWQAALEEANVEPEVVLFHSLVCGVQFQFYRTDSAAVTEELRRWLVSPPRGMRPELAEVVVRALTRGINEAVDDQWRTGPQGEPIALSHRPPETRGAWAAALVTEELLRQLGMGMDERERLTVELLQLLLGRPVAGREYDWRWRKTVGSAINELVTWLRGEYERLLTKSATRRVDARPEAKDPRTQKEWRARHRSLTYVFAVDGFEAGAQSVATRVPPALWSPITATTGGPAVIGSSDDLAQILGAGRSSRKGERR